MATRTERPTKRPTVHELQQLAREAAKPRRRRRPGPSRAARLQLIDSLSRGAGPALALLAGATVFIAATAGRAFPLRAAIWAALVIGALYLCRRLAASFRAGERCAARPFRWRADYAAALCVLGAAFGAGATIALPAGAPADLAFRSLALLLAAVFGAALLHAPHGRAAMGLLVPACGFILLGAARADPTGWALAAFAAATILAGAAILVARGFLRARAMQRFPRTRLARREKRPTRGAPPAPAAYSANGRA